MREKILQSISALTILFSITASWFQQTQLQNILFFAGTILFFFTQFSKKTFLIILSITTIITIAYFTPTSWLQSTPGLIHLGVTVMFWTLLITSTCTLFLLYKKPSINKSIE